MTQSFDVWAPHCWRVGLLANGERHELAQAEHGWWRVPESVAADIMARGDGQVDYGYLLNDDPHAYPDPRTRFQPKGVHDLSRTFDPAQFSWTDENWRGRALAGGSIYEMHVGTFTPEGTLDSAIERLDHLVDLGVDFVEVMPVNAFNGEHGWGYDGVDWYAVHHAYGGPEAYMRFVDACHDRGLGVIQDVVYNHLGPSGNYLPRFGPYLDESRQSPWGAAINLNSQGSDQVREYILANAEMWMRDYHVDGLRLDATHQLQDDSDLHILAEMSDRTAALSAQTGRPLTLIAENENNDPTLITPRDQGGYGLTALWSDDFHHALTTRQTGEYDAYLGDFRDPDALRKTLDNGFYHDGTYSPYRGHNHGHPVDPDVIAGHQLVVFSTNHDQTGNRADGARLRTRVSQRQLEQMATLTLLNANTPMIFQGEEWGADTPFQYFTSHPEPDLGASVSEGRKREFERMGWDLSNVPDPQDPATFTNSKLNWTQIDRDENRRLYHLHRQLLALRKEFPELADPHMDKVRTRTEPGQPWVLVHRGDDMAVVANLGNEPVTIPLDYAADAVLVSGDVTLRPTVESEITLGEHSTALIRRRVEQGGSAGLTSLTLKRATDGLAQAGTQVDQQTSGQPVEPAARRPDRPAAATAERAG